MQCQAIGLESTRILGVSATWFGGLSPAGEAGVPIGWPTLARTAVVTPDLAGPLDRAVRVLFEASWGKARGWIQAGKVRVGEALVLEATARVAAGDHVTVDERARSPRGQRSELPDASILHCDAHVVVVSKPAGISTVPFEGEAEDTLDARVRRWLELKARGASRPNLGVVHRIDKETTGLVVFTRTWLAKQKLAAQFRAHTVHRRYLALAHGAVRSGTSRSYLIENRGDGLRGSARGTAPPNARLAVTHVEVLESLGRASLVACRLETGRTHQIRIHLSESGHPIVGEKVYVRRFGGIPIAAPRLMLHAAELGFEHPVTGQDVSWEEPMPADMQAMLERLRSG